MTDDLGYSEVGYRGEVSGIQTPNIDQLAREGMVFPNAYAASPVCSPTRASILTGKYPAELKLTCHVPGMGMKKYLSKIKKANPYGEAFFVDRLPHEEVTIAEALKEEGYRTAFIGKWHLSGEGSARTSDGVVDADFHPDRMGFDINIAGCAYGQPASYFSPYRNATIADGPDGEYLTDRLANEAVAYIRKNADAPFFLMLSTYTVHTPLQVPQEAVERNDGNKYYAMVEELDRNVGVVLDELEASGIAENTIVLFYSDNGSLKASPSLRGRKGSLFEGGIRVPFVVRWPRRIESNVSNDTLVNSVDIFPTLLEAVGAAPRSNLESSGVSLIPALTENQVQSRGPIYWHFPHNRSTAGAMGTAIRDGKWKLIHFYDTKSTLLFDLERNPSERNDTASQYPEKVDDLFKKLTDWHVQMDAEMPLAN